MKLISGVTIDLLKGKFGESVISRNGPVEWPPRSCEKSKRGKDRVCLEAVVGQEG